MVRDGEGLKWTVQWVKERFVGYFLRGVYEADADFSAI
jgi:hypothetical protein